MNTILKKDSLEKLYNSLLNETKILAPVNGKNNKVEFKYNPDYKQITYDHIQSTLSVKNVVFPKTENLMTYTSEKKGTEIHDINLENVPNVILWGSHPCDNQAYAILESIFCWTIKDEFFLKRLEKLLVIGLACHKSDAYCFCTSVGIAPDSEKGSDILLSLTNSGDFIAKIITEKGKSFYEKHKEFFDDYKDENPVITTVDNTFSREEVSKKLKTAFDHPFWVENSLRCIGCGTCAYVCPTCACFDIQDETKGKEGRRYRSWDSCCTSLFTLHTSGHNPREVQSARWRQRIMHKFSYMPINNQTFGCVGCGRCSRACPVDMNIAEQLVELQHI